MQQVYAAGSEDMDTLTFNAPILYRHLTFSEAKKAPISEINLQSALEGLEMNMSQVEFTTNFLDNHTLTNVCSSSTYVYCLAAIILSQSRVSGPSRH